MSNGITRRETRCLGEPQAVEAAKAEIGKPLTVIATGGLATLFDQQAQAPAEAAVDRVEEQAAQVGVEAQGVHELVAQLAGALPQGLEEAQQPGALEDRVLVDGAGDAPVEELPQGGHAHHAGDMGLAKGGLQGLLVDLVQVRDLGAAHQRQQQAGSIAGHAADNGGAEGRARHQGRLDEADIGKREGHAYLAVDGTGGRL